MMGSSPAPLPSLTQGRWLVALAAVLWSLSGGFSKVLTRNTPFGLNSPEIDGLVMAFYRAFFAGLVLVPALGRRDLSFRPLMVGMMVCFAAMNALFVTALKLGTAANAILLQYTAPMWMYLVAVLALGEPADRRSSVSLAVGMVGIAIIILGGWQGAQVGVVLLGLGSGVTYAGVILFLRVLRDASPRWLTVLNHLFSALILVPLVWTRATPTPAQLVVLFFFGAVQMALPYWLMARGLRVVSPQEAGTITLLEPLLNPVWAFLVAGEVPETATFLGGPFILAALAWRYWPFGRREAARSVAAGL